MVSLIIPQVLMDINLMCHVLWSVLLEESSLSPESFVLCDLMIPKRSSDVSILLSAVLSRNFPFSFFGFYFIFLAI